MGIEDGTGHAAGFEQSKTEQHCIAHARPDGVGNVAVQRNVLNQSGVDTHADNNQNGDAISNEDLSQAVDNARSFDGKPITDNDKNIIKGILKGYFSQK